MKLRFIKALVSITINTTNCLNTHISQQYKNGQSKQNTFTAEETEEKILSHKRECAIPSLVH